MPTPERESKALERILDEFTAGKVDAVIAIGAAFVAGVDHAREDTDATFLDATAQLAPPLPITVALETAREHSWTLQRAYANWAYDYAEELLSERTRRRK